MRMYIRITRMFTLVQSDNELWSEKKNRSHEEFQFKISTITFTRTYVCI